MGRLRIASSLEDVQDVRGWFGQSLATRIDVVSSLGYGLRQDVTGLDLDQMELAIERSADQSRFEGLRLAHVRSPKNRQPITRLSWVMTMTPLDCWAESLFTGKPRSLSGSGAFGSDWIM